MQGGATFVMGSANVTLYAVWTVITYTVTYNPNGATSGIVPVDSNNYQQGATVTVLGNAGGLAMANYTFAGWNTSAGGTGTGYIAGSTFTMGSANVILYAIWAPTYTVTYSANGTLSSGSAPSTANYQQGAIVTVSGNTGGMTMAGYSFAGWFTRTSGLLSTYTAGSTFQMGALNVKLWAVWIPNGINFTSSGNNITITGGEAESLNIPYGVTGIGAAAFLENPNLTSITIPTSVTSIGTGAFYECSSLTGITVLVGNSCYQSDISGVLFNLGETTLIQAPCGLTGSYTIPTSVTGIGQYAFYECPGLTSVTIPSGITGIGDYAFGLCTGLTSVTISSGVTGIGAGMFFGCSDLTSVAIPSSVASIGSAAFESCSGLTSVTFVSANCTFADKSVFESDNSSLTIYAPAGGTVQTYCATIPNLIFN
jgi:hypothetical protein